MSDIKNRSYEDVNEKITPALLEKNHLLIQLDEFKEAQNVSFEKKDFVLFLKELTHEKNMHVLNHSLKEIKPIYEHFVEKSKAEACHQFVENGGQKEDFFFRKDEWDISFEEFYTDLRKKLNHHFTQQEEEKTRNYRERSQLLDRLRQLLDAEDSKQTFDMFKAIHREWNSLEDIHFPGVKTLWANYHALVDRFYDTQNIYFELKELDRKKNLEIKEALCEQVENLLQEPQLSKAMHTLHILHRDFKHIGPVPKSHTEIIWNRFKAATDAMHARRDAWIDENNKKLKNDLLAKENLYQKIDLLSATTPSTATDFGKITHQILEIKQRWEQIGSIPNKQGKNISKRFWQSFKSFFQKKRLFFKQLDQKNREIKKVKKSMLAEANTLKDSTDWERITQVFKELQLKWKGFGRSWEKENKKLDRQFQETCDYFFEKRREASAEIKKVYEDQAKQREGIMLVMNKQIKEKTTTIDQYRDYVQQFFQLTPIPRDKIFIIQKKWKNISYKYLENIDDLSELDREEEKLKIRSIQWENGPEDKNKVQIQERDIRRRITSLENKVITLQNNLSFFKYAKNADPLKEKVHRQIQDYEKKIQHLKDLVK